MKKILIAATLILVGNYLATVVAIAASSSDLTTSLLFRIMSANLNPWAEWGSGAEAIVPLVLIAAGAGVVWARPHIAGWAAAAIVASIGFLVVVPIDIVTLLTLPNANVAVTGAIITNQFLWHVIRMLITATPMGIYLHSQRGEEAPFSKVAARSTRAGFTLIELLAVIVIIAVLAGLLLSVVARAKKPAYVTQDIAQMHQVYVGILLYEQDHDDVDPASLTGTYPYVKSKRVYKSPVDTLPKGSGQSAYPANLYVLDSKARSHFGSATHTAAPFKEACTASATRLGASSAPIQGTACSPAACTSPWPRSRILIPDMLTKTTSATRARSSAFAWMDL